MQQFMFGRRVALLLVMVLALAMSACQKEPPKVALDALPAGDAERGEALFGRSIDGAAACSTCHALTDARGAGPGLEGYAGHAEDRVDDEDAEEYTYYAILRPSRYVVSGYSNVMPSNYEEKLSDQDLADLIAFLLTLE